MMKKRNNTTYKKYFLITMVMATGILPACRKFVEIESPRTELVREIVFTEDATANAAMEGIYVQLSTNSFVDGWYTRDIAYISGKSADELKEDNGDGIELAANEATPLNGRINSVWSTAYESVYKTNAVIEGLSNSNALSVSAKQQIMGEAKFTRAFDYFYLVNLFGDVPLLLSTDYKVNAVEKRIAVNEVYDQIIEDLVEAQASMVADYSLWDGQRVRPNKWAATALLARVYLYVNDWSKAEAEATKVINNTGLYQLENDLNDVFLINSSEAIWQFYGHQANVQSQHGYLANNGSSRIQLTNEALNAFEPNDSRRVDWVRDRPSWSHIWKYKIGVSYTWTEYTTNLRLAEQYLIRAEARAQLNDIPGAQNDINIIRNRAGLANTTANDKASLLDAIEQERRIEFLSEYGHRWLDLKRWGKVDAVIGTLKPATWQPADALYPIPQEELNKNINLTQNPGY